MSQRDNLFREYLNYYDPIARYSQEYHGRAIRFTLYGFKGKTDEQLEEVTGKQICFQQKYKCNSSNHIAYYSHY